MVPALRASGSVVIQAQAVVAYGGSAELHLFGETSEETCGVDGA
jgi:hypothetical protein